jgi:arylsulfatase A-like enzyme
VSDLNVLLVSIDSLSRQFLDAYDGSVEFDVETENLDRFADRAVTFDTHYAGSLPCMPARREWLTGTQEFLWRPWGPIEPFDDPLPREARRNGVLTQLLTDHFHYFQHGSHGYYEDFNGFEFVRGHEYDAWRTAPVDPDPRLLSQTTAESTPDGGDFNLDDDTSGTDPHDLRFMNRAQYARNVERFEELDETDFFAPAVFSRVAEWLRENRGWDQWFCYVDSFDVHEPFHCPEPYASMYTDADPTDPDLPVWPYYGHVDEGQSALTDRQLEFVRAQFAGKLTMVDRWFGRVLDALDRTDAWEDTAVVVTSDHGHYLGEHGWIGKPTEAPLYDVLARTPLLVWHPDSPRLGDRVDGLTAAVDLYATVADLLGLGESVDPRHSRSLGPILDGERDGADHREWALYGYWGSSVNVTDGEYTYLHPCDEDVDAHCYSTEMMKPYGWFTPRTHRSDAEPARLPYADGPVWEYTAASHSRQADPMLFAVDDFAQETDLADVDGYAGEIDRMRSLLVDALDELEAPDDQYDRLGLS